jgi:hypothetical protein
VTICVCSVISISHTYTCYVWFLFLCVFYRYLYSFLSYLVERGVFESIEVNYLPVGHTHEDIDQVCSVPICDAELYKYYIYIYCILIIIYNNYICVCMYTRCGVDSAFT